VRRVAAAAGVLVLLLAVALALPPGRALAQEITEVFVRNWPESFRIAGPVEVTGGPLRQAAFVARTELVVPPVARGDTARLFDAGVIQTEGFPAVVLSLAGQTRGQVGRTGEVGAFLVPDEEFVRQAFDEGRQTLFPLEVAVRGVGPSTAYFQSDQPRYLVAFPRYRVLLYNTTDKSVTANLYAYLTE
jgi:hypothetical protein